MTRYAATTKVPIVQSRNELERTLERLLDARYAATTKVPIVQSRNELERTLERYGADQFVYGSDAEGWVVRFRAHERFVQMRIDKPDDEREQRQRWRALNLVVKAKLESIESGLETFEQAFLANVVLPDGSTVGEFIAGDLEEAYSSGLMPKRLLELPQKSSA
jgi:hypothetical protein